MISTYQTRVSLYTGMDRLEGDAALAAYAGLYGRVQRKLFADVAAGRRAISLEERLLGAVRDTGADGSTGCGCPWRARWRRSGRLRNCTRDTLRRRISRAEGQISDAGKQGRWQQVHQKRRRLGNLRGRLAALESDIAGDKVRLCFGSKRLWRKQHDLKANGYTSHEEWLADWEDARKGEFFVLGSRDETGGCQLCVAAIADDGSLTLRLRMPDCLAEQHGKVPGHPRRQVRLWP